MFVNFCLLSPIVFFQMYNVCLAIFWPSFFFFQFLYWGRFKVWKNVFRNRLSALCSILRKKLGGVIFHYVQKSSDQLSSFLPVIFKLCFSNPLLILNTMMKKLILLPPIFYLPLTWLQKRGQSWKLDMCLSSQIPAPFLCSMHCNKLVVSKLLVVAPFPSLPYLHLVLCVQIW